MHISYITINENETRMNSRFVSSKIKRIVTAERKINKSYKSIFIIACLFNASYNMKRKENKHKIKFLFCHKLPFLFILLRYTPSLYCEIEKAPITWSKKNKLIETAKKITSFKNSTRIRYRIYSSQLLDRKSGVRIIHEYFRQLYEITHTSTKSLNTLRNYYDKNIRI